MFTLIENSGVSNPFVLGIIELDIEVRDFSIRIYSGLEAHLCVDLGGVVNQRDVELVFQDGEKGLRELELASCTGDWFNLVGSLPVCELPACGEHTRGVDNLPRFDECNAFAILERTDLRCTVEKQSQASNSYE